MLALIATDRRLVVENFSAFLCGHMKCPAHFEILADGKMV